MKRVVFVRLFVFVWMMVIVTQISAQHFISVQSDDKQPFAIQVNGISFSSTKTGSIRIANLSGGSYNLIVTLAGKKYPPQNFTCVVDKSDESFTLKNLGKDGWVLKSIKGTGAIESSTPVVQPAKATAKTEAQPPKTTAFARMLAEAIDDPDLLKATPWVLTTKVDEPVGTDVADMGAQAQAADTSAYVPETKGVIKAVEQPVKEGTELVFVDFNATGGDTIHIVIPSSGNDANTADTVAQAPLTNINAPVAGSIPLVKNDTAMVQQAPVAFKDSAAVNTDSAAVSKKNTSPAEQMPAFDTSAGKKFSNPFFKKDTVEEKNEGVAEKNIGTEKSNNSADLPTQVQNTTAAGLAAGNTVKATVKADCKKMLSDNDEEKLKHKIYLETDETKILDITRRYLDGKCINTAQVKELAAFFLSDEARYNFFFTVYPSVYDYGNFGGLEAYMIDKKYKNMFQAMLK